MNLKRLKTFYGDVDRRVDSMWLDEFWGFINTTEQAASSLSKILFELRGGCLAGDREASVAERELDETAVRLLRERIEHLPYLAQQISTMDARDRRAIAQSDAEAFAAEAKMVCAAHAAATYAPGRADSLVWQ